MSGVNCRCISCVLVLETMNEFYQRCLSTCKQVRASFSSTQTQTCYIDMTSVSATSLLYRYAIDAVCCFHIHYVLRLHLKPDKSMLLKLSVRSAAGSEFQTVGTAWQYMRLPKTVLAATSFCRQWSLKRRWLDVVRNN